MSTAEKQYFSLLRATLWGTPVDTTEAIDWDAVMRIAEHHGNNVLLSDVAFRLDVPNRPSPQLAARMQSEMRANLFKQMKLKQIMVSAVKLLREHHIEPVLLKGFSLAMLYPNPNLRQFGDIDLFVGRQQFHESCALLRTLPGGYNWGEEREVGHHYNIEFGSLPMEVHRVSADIDDPKTSAIYDAIEKEGLIDNRRVVDFEGFPLPVPSKEFAVFFTFLHVWEHFTTTGVGWRQLSDVAIILHAYRSASEEGQPFDEDKLRGWLASMHLMQPWQTFGWLMVNRLGLPETELPFYDPRCQRRALKLYTRVMGDGNFRRDNHHKRSKPHGKIAQKAHSFIGIFADFFQLATVFPQQALHGLSNALKTSFSKNFQKKMIFFSPV